MSRNEDYEGLGGGAPTGAAGGDLAGTYPNPTVKGATAASAAVWTCTIEDNLARGLAVVEGANDYFLVVTTDGGEDLFFGNATTNPGYTFLGSGVAAFNGGIQIAGGTFSITASFNGFNTVSAAVIWDHRTNQDGSLRFRAGGKFYFELDTRSNLERVEAQQIFSTSVITTVDMADVTHTLVLGTAGANETKLLGNIVFVDPNSTGASEQLPGPPEANMQGVTLYIANTGGEDILFRDNANAVTIVTISPNETAIVFCNGVVYRGGIMAET